MAVAAAGTTTTTTTTVSRIKNNKLAGALLIIPLLVFLLTLDKDGVVSAFVASTLKGSGRTPTPALIVVRDPSTVPAIDWDVFEMEEQRAFDGAAIIPPSSHSRIHVHPKNFQRNRPPLPPLSDLEDDTSSSVWFGSPDTTPGTTEPVHPTIVIAPDDPDAWKGSLLMTAGLLVGHHDIPALMLLLSTAATGEFGTAVRLTSRCLWHSVDVCRVLSTEGFQSITELLKDVGVLEDEQQSANKGGNWMMSWAKRTWKDAVHQERKWADSIRQSLFVGPDHVTSNEPKEETTATSTTIQAKETLLVPNFAATLRREDGVVFHLPLTTSTTSNNNNVVVVPDNDKVVLPQLPKMVTTTDPVLESSNKQRVRDLMRQRRELQQHPRQVEAMVVTPELFVKTAATPTIVVVDQTVTNASATTVATSSATAGAASRQRVRDLLRQKRDGMCYGSVLTLADHQVTVATPSLVRAENENMMATTTTDLLHPAEKSAADSRQRVRDLMRLQRERQQGYAAPARMMTTSTSDYSITAPAPFSPTSPRLFTSPYATSSVTNLQSATQRAAHSRQRVRDLLRQKKAREVNGSTEEMAAVTPTLVHVPAPAPVPDEKVSTNAATSSSSFSSMEEVFRSQRALNAAVRNKIRGIKMQKLMVDDGTLKGMHGREEDLYKVSASGRSPLTMTEKKSLAQVRVALSEARKLQTHLSAVPDRSSIEPETIRRRSWRRKIVQLLNGASPHGWVKST